MRTRRSTSDLVFLKHPWIPAVCFLAMLCGNTILSYSQWSLLWKMEAGFFLLLLPFTALLYGIRNGGSAASFSFTVRPWAWGTLLFAALIPRLFRLDTLSSWPVADEGMLGYFATRLENHWDWQLVHSPFNFPVAYSWILCAFFSLFKNSLTTLWLVPALLGWGCLCFWPFSGRRWFAPSTHFAVGLWLAFGFWPLFLSRFSHQAILLVFWECLVLVALSRCWEKAPGPGLTLPWIGLALLTGLGFYTYLAWPMVAFMVLVAFLASSPRPAWKKGLMALQFASWTLLPAIPLFLSFAKDYHFYFQHLWAFGRPQNLWERLQLPLDYVRALFWGSTASFGYGPLWAGMMNPIQGSLVFLGFIGLFEKPSQPRNLWILAALGVFISPAFLTNNFEMMRLTVLIPPLAFLAARGTLWLLSNLSPAPSLLGLALLLGTSFTVDAYHLFWAYPDLQKNHPSFFGMHKSPEFEKAFSILKAASQKKGPGLILLNALPDPFDQTLPVAAFSFNAAENKDLDPGQARWAAALANAHEAPYFKKFFPEGEVFPLSENLGRPDGGMILELIPARGNNRALLAKWAKADSALGELTRLVMEKGVTPDQGEMLGTLDKAYPEFKGDPILESRFWRLKALHLAAGGMKQEAIKAYRSGIQKGLPLAQLYNEMGCLMYKEQDLAGAQKAFETAIGLKPNLTEAKVNLENLLLIKSKEQLANN